MNEPKQLEVMKPATLSEEYPLLADEEMREALDVTAQPIEILNLPKIKVPQGSSTDFLVETVEGDVSLKVLEGILTASRQARLYYARPYGSGGRKPPDCTSIDAFVGIGDPGGNCRECPNAKFGTAVKPDGTAGPGQACRHINQILFLLPGALLPHLLVVPPTSIKAYTHYTNIMRAAGATPWASITRLTLETATSDSGIKYPRLVFRLARKLDPTYKHMLAPYNAHLRSLLSPAVVDASNYEFVEDATTTESNPDDIPF